MSSPRGAASQGRVAATTRSSPPRAKRRRGKHGVERAPKGASRYDSEQAALLFYLITLSAHASTVGGIVRPICLAVFRLITSSNFVGCSTGRSAGLVPVRILSTYQAPALACFLSLVALLCCDERPAHNRATNRTPPAESLIDLGCQRSLLPKRTLGLNLRIRDIAHRNPARGLVPHLTGDEPQHSISHFRHITQPLKVIIIIQGIEAKEISRHDG